MPHSFTWEGRQYEARFWNGETLGPDIAVDTETTYVDHFYSIPELITFQAFDGKSRVYFVKRKDVERFLSQHVSSNFIFHNAPFDLDVISKWCGWSWHNQLLKNKVFDTQILYTLFHLATEGYVPKRSSLKHVTQMLLDKNVEKNSDVRTTFGDYLIGGEVKYGKIPKTWYKYAAIDAIATHNLWAILKLKIPKTGSKTLLSHQIQLLGAVALDHIYKNGIGFDLERKEKFLSEIDDKMEEHRKLLARYGWARGMPGLKDVYEKIVTDLGLKLPRTGKTGRISQKADDIRPYRDNEFINAFLSFHELEKTRNFFADINTPRVHPKYRAILNTGRTGCRNPNIQNLPRAPGVRQLFIPSPGNVFLDVDYSQLELCTLAQITYSRYGKSVMRDVINDGRDLHKYYASILLNKPEDKITKEERQKAKVSNFGFPGGLGISNFTKYAEMSYGVKLTEEEAKNMKKAWLEAFPEMKEYLKGVADKETVSTLTGRIRADASYCAARNTPFQGLAADGAKLALYAVYAAGFKIAAFIHDQIMCDEPRDEAEEKLDKLQEIMVKSMQKVVPDVKIKVEGQILERFQK